MARDEAGQLSSDWPEKPCRLDAKLRSFRAYYSGNDRETLTYLRRAKREPHQCFRIITQGLEGLTLLKAWTLISRLYYGLGQKRLPRTRPVAAATEVGMNGQCGDVDRGKRF